MSIRRRLDLPGRFFASLRSLLAASLCITISNQACAQEPDLGASQLAISNVAGALASVPAEGRLLKFTHDAIDLPAGGHLQGIQLQFDAPGNRYVALLSHDSDTLAYLIVVEFPADLTGEGRVTHVQMFPSDGQSPPLRHAGGMQLVGSVLAVGLEDNQQKTRSEVEFWDVSDPRKPSQLTHLTLRRSGAAKDKTAGAVGLVAREKDHLLAVANWDSRAIDFYTTNGRPLTDPRCRFEFRVRWQDEMAKKTGWLPDQAFAAYQAINLAADAQGNVFLIGFASTASQDLVDLFSLDMRQRPEGLLRKLAVKPIKLQAGNHFRYSGGISIAKDGMAILSSPAQLGRQTSIHFARSRADGPRSGFPECPMR